MKLNFDGRMRLDDGKFNACSWRENAFRRFEMDGSSYSCWCLKALALSMGVLVISLWREIPIAAGAARC